MDDRSQAQAPDGTLLGGRTVLERPGADGAPAVGGEPRAPVPPTGCQFELRRDGVRAVVTEVGATLRALEVGDLRVLDGFAGDGLPDASRGQVLIPYPNRVDHGRYVFHGGAHQLPLDETDRGNAMHGLVRWINWAPLSRGPRRLVMGLVLHAREGYPFVLSLRVAYTLTPSGLRVRQSVRNLGASPAPYGAGFHPYLSVGLPRIDDAVLRLPAETYFLVNPRLIPTGRATVAGTPFDFRLERPIGETVMDTGFTDLVRDDDGLVRVALSAPGGGPRLTVLLDRGYQFLQLYTGDTLPEPSARRRALAIEPYTCAPNALNNGLGLRVLPPGATFSSVFEVAVGGV
jgi:aldose 1-epimerase